MNRKAVSPVIGTILMVAVAVILSAVLAGLVFGITHRIESPPNANFVLEDAQSNITSNGGDLFIATLYGGDTLICKDIEFQIVNTSSGRTYTLIWNDILGCFVYRTASGYQMYAYGDIGGGTINVGDTITFNETTAIIGPGTLVEVRVIHIPTNTVIFDGSVLVK